MESNSRLARALKWVAWLTWIAIGLPEAITFARSPGVLSATQNQAWLLAYLTFPIGLWMAARAENRINAMVSGTCGLILAVASVIVMMAMRPNCYAGALVVVTAWQATLLLPVIWSAALIAVQTIGVFIVLQWFSGEQFGWAIAAIYLSYEVFAAATAWVAKNETSARTELSRANAELRATQLLLAQSSRIGERLRISRDLHDVLGHDLTALALHLEVARNSPGDARDEVGAARDIAKELLTKVREVVSLMRTTDHCDLSELLSGLASDGPAMKVHLSVAEGLNATDAGRAHALLRCLQEVITNARKHSGASNLWVDVRREGASLVTTARDDGCGLARKGRHNAMEKQGHGLKGIEERLSEFGGTLILADGADKGCALRITLPGISAPS